MPVAHRSTYNSSGNTGTGFVTFSYTSGSGSDRLLLVQTRLHAGGSVSAVSYAGAGLTNAGTAGGMVMWRKTAPATGANNVTIACSSYQTCLFTVSDWTGVDQTTPLGTQVTASGSSSSPATASITCPANGLVVGGVWSAYSVAPGTVTAGSGTTMSGFTREGANGNTKADGRRANTGTLSWTLSTVRAWDAQGFPVNPSVSFTAKLPSVYSQAIQGSVI